jgi:hypothetical protein
VPTQADVNQAHHLHLAIHALSISLEEEQGYRDLVRLCVAGDLSATECARTDASHHAI